MMSALAALAAQPALAADWWLITQPPGQPAALFGDLDSLTESDGTVELRILRIDRSGREEETVRRFQCRDRPASGQQRTLQRFACASDRAREALGLILVAESPREAARILFDTERRR